MPSEMILPSDPTDAIPKNDSVVVSEREMENPAAVESNQGKQDDNVLHENSDASHAKTQDDNTEANTTMADSEANKETKDDDAKDDDVKISDNEKANVEHSALVSTAEHSEFEYTGRRVAKQFRVSSNNKINEDEGGKVNKIFFGTVGNLVQGKENLWRILYDDGDVDMMSRTNILDAITYYDKNKEYDTNHAHKKPTSLLPENNDTVTDSTTKKRKKNTKTKSSPPKKGKKTKAKVERKEQAPVWEGPPDEDIDGGWPKGWLKKVFARKNGASKGSTDRYWYSPKESFKLRSMVQVKKFLKALKETKGDEKMAKKAMLKY